MAAAYFQTANLDSPPFWAEIQFTGWMIDGGILLIALYVGALAVGALAQWNVAHAPALSAARDVWRGRLRRATSVSRR